MSKDKQSMTLTPEQFRHLGTLIDFERSLISPLPAKGEAVEISEEQKKQLVDDGLLDASGNIESKASKVFEAFAKADSFARVAVGLVPFFEIMVFFCDDRRVALLTGPETVTVLTGDEPDGVPGLVAEYVGRTNLCAIEYDVALSNGEAIVLAAAIDVRRRQLLSAIADDASAIPYPITSDEIIAQAGNDGVQWISSHVRAYIGDENNDVRSGLSGIVEKGLLKTEGDGYVCSDQLEAVAQRFLVINNRITLQGSRVVNEKSVMTTHLEMLRCGLAEILVIESKGGGQLQLCTLSPNEAIAVITDMTTNPSAMTELETADEVSLKESDKCSSCGVALADGVKFCPECGTKVANNEPPPPLPANICKKCGAKLEPSDKFCIKCGTKT